MTDTYEYDVWERLLSLDLQTAVNPSDRGAYGYSYDARTRRVSRSELDTSTVLSFVGGVSVQEYAASPGTPPSSLPAPTVEYVRGPDMGGGVGGILYSVRGGAASLAHSSARGDVIAKVDETTSAMTWQAQYEAFGRRPEETGTNLDRQRANSKEEDPTGLLNEGFRYRDLETGTFITRDPAGFVDGPNLYTYVRQNPWTHFDPHGLAEGDLPTTVVQPRLQKRMTSEQEKQLVDKFKDYYQKTEATPAGGAFFKEMRGNTNTKVEWKLDTTSPQAATTITKGGNILITINPITLSARTIAHEVGGHADVIMNSDNSPISGTYGTPQFKQQMKQREEKSKDAANKIAPLHSDQDKPRQEVENRAIRAGNIVYAEMELMKMPSDQRKEIPAILVDRKGAIWNNKDVKHQHNADVIPAGTEFGGYTFDSLKTR